MSNHSIPHSMKRAAIYVRVSTEAQAGEDKVSPQEQETDCRALCGRRGYPVVEVYRDTEKYKVGRKMVEPSGTRSDRPQFRRMLQDYDDGHFDVIVCWSTDRLYRGVSYAVIDLKDRLRSGRLVIELVNGTFDLRTMEILAWAAGEELQNIRARHRMGVAARLRQGKVWASVAPYGYTRTQDGDLVINEEEAAWVRQIYRWYAEGLKLREIRIRLIRAGARQRGAYGSKYTWSVQAISNYLRNDIYHTGILVTTWAGQTYEASIPVLIDIQLATQVKVRQEGYARFPAGNIKTPALAPGQVYCHACNYRMTLTSRVSSGGQRKRYAYYRCLTDARVGEWDTDCCRSVRVDSTDDEIWRRTYDELRKPHQLKKHIKKKIATLQAKEAEVEPKIARLERKLFQEIPLERQKVITWARTGVMKETDLPAQLLALETEEMVTKRELDDARLSASGSEQLQWLMRFLQEIQVGLEEANKPGNFDKRRRIVQVLVERVNVMPDKSIKVDLIFDEESQSLVDHSEPSPWILNDRQSSFQVRLTV